MPPCSNRLASPVTPLPAVRFDSIAGEKRLKEHFGVAALEGFGRFSRGEIAALGGLLDYVVMTQAGRVPHFRQPRQELPCSVLLIDPATRANLELTRTASGDKRGSLLAVIDHTMTAAGSRCLSARLSNPLLDPKAIAARLDQVALLHGDRRLREDLRRALSNVPDLERAMGRIIVARGGPRDLAAIRDALIQLQIWQPSSPAIRTSEDYPQGLRTFNRLLRPAMDSSPVNSQPRLPTILPLMARDGGFIRTGYSADLDENRALRDETRQVVAGLQSRYADLDRHQITQGPA